MSLDECVSSSGHSWYLTHWSSKRLRYERECSLMGCQAWQYLEGTMVAKERVLPSEEGMDHVHEWKPWNGTDKDTVSDNLRYFRGCRTCKAVEGTSDLREIGNWVYFTQPRDREIAEIEKNDGGER